MIRRFSRLFISTPLTLKKNQFSSNLTAQVKYPAINLCKPNLYYFSALPKHSVLNMPALSPTMSEGKILKWNKNIGDLVQEGDIICEVETDKATVGFQATQKGFLAQKRETDKPVTVGTPLIVVVKKKEDVSSFSAFNFDGKSSVSAPSPAVQKASEKKIEASSPPLTAQKAYPNHSKLLMPALSPTMSEGKIIKWNVKQGQTYSQGDSLCDIETDKATVAFEATQKGVLAKIFAQANSQMKVGDVLGISVKKKQDANKFSDYNTNQVPVLQNKPAQASSQAAVQTTTQNQAKQFNNVTDGRVFASPAAKTLANSKGINLNQIGKGSGPQGRIIRQDVESFKTSEKAVDKIQEAVVVEVAKKQTPAPSTPSKPKTKVEFPQNPFEEIPLSNMRKTIASRLTQSKTTIPHYYIQASIQMDRVNALRNQLNVGEKQNGVKISVNDIIVKAMALALRDYPNVNAQWHGNVVRKFKHADVSVAVATDSGLITPIVYRAETLGLLDIARRTKDIAKRAREGKLDPREYIGGTTTVSNIGMFGIDSVTSVINPPQSTIVGVGKTQKKILFDEKSTNPEKPYRVAEVMQVIVSADHRVVDGAVAAQWLMRIKKYLQNPSQMLL